ncbi:twin-arginine translocase subunit TatC [Vulgatibacter sp.]|uniref:twin-arginine translocase subunit TatC n=1 Tax=Vulgatibacter sp. TaxID=1971226 RepID=UPI0035691CB6
MSTDEQQQPSELRLSLLEHLKELRSRLFRVTLAVLVLGSLSLAFAREFFHFLVLPILQALPEGQRALVQTSAIEEINTFLKVGIYAGVFLSAPVILQQIWGFVSPGLYANERRMALPFIGAGTACFVAGAAFCYFVVLPPAFEFLLKPEEARAAQTEMQLARGAVEDAGRLIRAGDLPAAETLLEKADGHLEVLPDGSPDGLLALQERASGLDPLLDAAERVAGGSPPARAALAEAIAARHDGRAAALAGDRAGAVRSLDAAERAVRRAWALGTGGAEGARAELLLERHAGSTARLAAAAEQVTIDDWTRPMLSMKEQLNLVLVLLLAFGLIFEIPVVFSLLAALGIVTGEGLASWRKYAIVVNVIVAAVITPTGDPFNLAMMAIPMVLCYEVGVISARIITARRRAREQALLAG